MGMVDANSCVINVLCYTDRKGTLELSRKGGKVERKLPEQAFAKDVPVAITLDKLKASTEYSYKIIFDDGTRQTTAASGGATLGDVLALSIALG